MKFSELIAQRLPRLRKEQSYDENELLKTLYLYRKEFGLDHKQLSQEPIPSFFIFLEQINKENRRQQEQMKRKK